MPARASLEGVPFDLDPDSVSYTFSMKTADTKALGGKVIQVYGTSISRITLTGSFVPVYAKGEREAWEAQARFREQVDTWATITETSWKAKPLRFIYPLKNWDLDVFIANYQAPDSYDATQWAVEKIAPKWQLEFRTVHDRTRAVTKGLRDLYLKRLMNGVGWKQTEYNGPTEADVTARLQGKTVREYLSSEAELAAQGQPTDPDAITTGGGN